MVSDPVLREYHRLRGLGWQGDPALRMARINVEFGQLELQGLVRFDVIPDWLEVLDDYDELLPQEKRDFRAQIAEVGVWGIASKYRCPCCDVMVTVDSVWGFIGEGWKDSGYDSDLKSTAIDKLKATRAALAPMEG